MFRVVLPPIIRSAYNYIYSIRYLSHRYCYLPLSWKSWNRSECAVGGVLSFKVKDEIHSSTGHESTKGINTFLYSISNLGARWGGWSTPHSARFTSRKETRYPFRGGWGGPRACVDACGKFRPYRGSNPGPSNP